MAALYSEGPADGVLTAGAESTHAQLPAIATAMPTQRLGATLPAKTVALPVNGMMSEQMPWWQPPLSQRADRVSQYPQYQRRGRNMTLSGQPSLSSSVHPGTFSASQPLPSHTVVGGSWSVIRPMSGIDAVDRPSTPPNVTGHYNKYFRSSSLLNPVWASQSNAAASGATSYPVAPQSLSQSSWPYSYLPDAPHRQAWAAHPTFRWFKRSSYSDVTDRWCEQGGKFSGRRGDNYYRPISLEEQREINEKIRRRIELRGTPRMGEW